jgi:hypothetical protein
LNKFDGTVAKVIDLSIPFDLGKKFDWVLCLEVGEHIPKSFEDILLKNLDRHNSKGIILSWATVGQKGYGHINEQSNEYIKNTMQGLGYHNDLKTENIFRRRSSLSWFKNTIMVFRKNNP